MEMTGATNPDRRAELWEMPDKRLFFMTPGTLKNDLAKGVQAAAELIGYIAGSGHSIGS